MITPSSHPDHRPDTPRPLPGNGTGPWTSIAALVGDLATRARSRAGEEIRYWRALRELRRLDDRDLDDLAIGRADLPELARRHARAPG